MSPSESRLQSQKCKETDNKLTKGSDAKNPPPRIYIQVARDKNSLEAGIYLSEYFKNHYGYALIPPEAMDESRLPSKIQLRYFDAGENSTSKEVLAQVQKALKCLGIEGKVFLADFSRVKGLARPYHFELWIPKLQSPKRSPA